MIPTINKYWTRLSKISWFVNGEEINSARETLTNHDILRQPSSIIVLSFDHRVCFFNEYPWEAKRSAIFTQERWQEGENTVSFTHEQNIICSQTLLDGIAHEQTIICRQLFAGQVVGSWPMKRKKNLLRMIITFMFIHLLL